MTNEEKQRLTQLLEIISPSMQEDDMTDFLAETWKTIAPSGTVRKDAIGNLEFSYIHNTSVPTLALCAHADTICIQITCAVGNGKYKFRSVGATPYMLLGQMVVVINEHGEKIDAVVGFDATSQYGQPKGLVFEDLWIDIPDEISRERVSVGDLAVLKPRYVFYGNDTLSSSTLDDRLGLFIIGEVLRKVVNNSIPINLICVATAQEEVGLRGSACFEYTQRPDATVVLDVDYATDIPTPHEDQMGRLYLNQGPGIQRKADNSRQLRSIIKELANIHGLPYQISLGRYLYGGTDTTSLQTAREQTGHHIANISIPCRYMHSPVETVSLNDVSAAIDIMVSLARNLHRYSL